MGIAFYDGKLFTLSRWEELFFHELFGDMNHHLIPIVYHDMEAQPAMITNRYLVVSDGKQKLLIVQWRRRVDQQAIDMWVFEADIGKARWLEVKDLGDRPSPLPQQELFHGICDEAGGALGPEVSWS
jgi:hypothetical protein